MNIEQLEQIKSQTSPTMCLAKFHEATIWLYASKIASCHHTPLVPTGENVITFYNPPGKRTQQDEMLKGGKPAECRYCWTFEDQGIDSDRKLKSLHFKNHLSAEEYLDREHNFKPKTLEIAFQNTCNLACCYCSPAFSTEWENDIRLNGNYQGLTTDKKLHYQRGIDNNVPVDMDLFWEWFNSVSEGLEEIRITGGEPLLHEATFKTFEIMQKINPNIICTVNTNLCQKPLVIERCINGENKLKNVRINVSNESAGEVAEFIRDGMVYDEWLNNVKQICERTQAHINISTTVTALSLVSLDQMYRDIFKIRVGRNPYISINIATYPEFQSIACLSREEREFYLNKYSNFFKEVESDLLEPERGRIIRILNILNPDLTDPKHLEYRNDSKIFFEQYCKRRNKTVNLADQIGLR